MISRALSNTLHGRQPRPDAAACDQGQVDGACDEVDEIGNIQRLGPEVRGTEIKGGDEPGG